MSRNRKSVDRKRKGAAPGSEDAAFDCGATRCRLLCRLLAASLLLAGSALPAVAQQSASYHISDHTLNAGGRPAGGVSASSVSYRLSLDAVGAGSVRPGLASASYHMDGSFAACYPPPGEALGLGFSDKSTLAWSPERSVGVYNLYRDSLAALAGGGYGSCFQRDLAAATATDSDPLAAGAGFFYLVTVENRLAEEGTKGMASDGAPRGGTVCP